MRNFGKKILFGMLALGFSACTLKKSRDSDVMIADAENCVQSVSDTLLEHIATQEAQGWPAVNRRNGLKMFGCNEEPGASFDPLTTPLNCFKDAAFTEIQAGTGTRDWKAPGSTVFTMKMIRDMKKKSSYWARSSADGRFLGVGLPDSQPVVIDGGEYLGDIEDFASAERPSIYLKARYDSGFLPDNKGFTFHGVGNGLAAFCNQTMLNDTAIKTIDPLAQPDVCTVKAMSVYQHVGGSADGSGYYAIVSRKQHFDDGGNSQLKDPDTVNFRTSTQQILVYPMSGQNNSFAVGNELKAFVPFEGDFVLSPSAKIFVSRIADRLIDNQQRGYRIRGLSVQNNSVKTTDLATICTNGGKASFSFDDRILANHHYVDKEDAVSLGFAGPDDPSFVQRIHNSSNIFIHDLKKKVRIRVTDMKPGQFALYPHFRSDGWMYFLVRDMNEGGNTYVVATDVGIIVRQ